MWKPHGSHMKARKGTKGDYDQRRASEADVICLRALWNGNAIHCVVWLLNFSSNKYLRLLKMRLVVRM